MSGKVALSLRVVLITTVLGTAVFMVFGRAVQPASPLPPSVERPYKPLSIDTISQTERARSLVPPATYHFTPKAFLDTVVTADTTSRAAADTLLQRTLAERTTQSQAVRPHVGFAPSL